MGEEYRRKDELFRKHFGDDYKKKSMYAVLDGLIKAMRPDPAAEECLRSGLEKMTAEEAEEVVYHFLEVEEALPAALKAMENGKRESQLYTKYLGKDWGEYTHLERYNLAIDKYFIPFEKTSQQAKDEAANLSLNELEKRTIDLLIFAEKIDQAKQEVHEAAKRLEDAERIPREIWDLVIKR